MSFDPSGIPGLTLWLDASRLGLVNGADVVNWPDLSPFNQRCNYEFQPGTNTPPVMRTGVNGLNGRPVVRYTTLQGRHMWWGLPIDREYTIIYVGRVWDATTANIGRVVAGDGNQVNILFGFWGGNEDALFVGAWPLADLKKAATTTWKLYSFDATAAANPRMFTNGVFLYGNTVATTGVLNTLCISGYSANNTAESSNCEMAELMVFSRKLSNLERQQVESYLRSKWLNAAPTVPVALLQDAFATGIDRVTTWPASTGAPNVYYDTPNKRVGIVTTPSYYSLKTPTTLTYNLLNSGIYAKCTPSPAVAGREFNFSLQNTDRSLLVSFTVYDTNLIAWTNPEPGGVDWGTATYDPVAHQWLRMRADNTNIYWDVSADGLAWHPFATAPVLPAIATMGRSWDFNGYSGNHDRIGVQNQTLTGLAPINPPGGGSYGVGTFYMSDTTPPWTPCVARVADTGLGGFAATHANVTGTLRPMAPGWTSLSFATPTSTAPQSWTATDGTNTAWRTNTAITTPQLVYGYTNTDASTPNFPVGSIFAIFVNGVEVARTYVTVATSVLEVRTEIPFAINDVLSLRYYNPTGSNINMVDSIQAGPGTRRPYLRVTGRMAETAGDYWICPTTGTYNLHAEICNGASFGFGYMITVNRKPLASVTIPYIISNTVADYSVQTMDANSVALTAGDMVGLGALMSDYNSGWLNRVDGAEGTAKPYLRATRVVPSAIISNDSWMVNFSQGGPAGSPDAFVDHVNVPPVDQSYSYGGYGDGPYGSPPPVWEPLQGPAGPSGDPDLGLYRPVSGRLTYPANWSEYGQPFGNSNVYRDRQGVCHLNTTIAGPASFAAGSTCCYLPIGFFPLNRVMLPGLIGNPQTGCRIDVNNTDGSIQVNSTTPAGETFVALDLVWFSAVPYLAVLDGLVVTSVVFQSGSSYLVTYTAGHLVNLAGVVTAIPAGSASVVASGVTWFCLIITAAGGVGQSYGNNSEASSCVGYYANSGNPANGALLATFSTGAGVRPVNDRRWLPYV